MGLADDFNGLKVLWGNLSPIAKVFLGASFLVTALSIGSLADAIFEFKGFVVGAVTGYRAVVAPIIEWIEVYIRLEISQQLFDLVVSVTLVVVAQDRALFKEVTEGVEIDIPILASFGLSAVVFYLLFLGVVVFMASLTGYVVATVFFAISWPTVFIVRPFIKRIFRRNFSKDDVLDLRAGMYILSIYLFVAVVAAISEGLARPLS